MPRKKKKKQLTIHSAEVKILIGLLVLIGGIAMAIAPFTEGELFSIITEITGSSALIWGILIFFAGLRTLFDHPYLNSWRPIIGLIMLGLTVASFESFLVPADSLIEPDTYVGIGGHFGVALHNLLNNYLGNLVEFLLLLLVTIIAFSLLSGVTLEQMKDFLEKIFGGVLDRMAEAQEKREEEKLDVDIIGTSSQDDPRKGMTDEEAKAQEYVGEQWVMPGSKKKEEEKKKLTEKEKDASLVEIDPITQDATKYVGDDSPKAKTEEKTTEDDSNPFGEPKFTNWSFPPSSIYQEPVKQKQDEKIHKRNAIVIEKTLRSFGIETRISKITIGPTVVQYALSITVGTKVSKIRNLSTDIALALATPESQVRIEAPIPGTSLIGIEIPNPTPNFVFVRDMVEELDKLKDKYKLPLIMGRNVANEPIIKDLTKLPHLLVAGATGSGKSAGINSILTGLLMSRTPDELKLLLVDPKMVEMAPYNGIPYLLTPVVTDMELVVNALQWSVEEMLRRYRQLKQLKVRNITEYNEKMKHTAMPYIVIVIDEMADLMLSTGVDVEAKIVRLAQMARAVGMHLILATQRPSVDVITGLIKANVPGRIAFSVATSIDSRVIIDQPGAEALIGNGDMMFKSPELSRPVRVQGAFTSTTDTENLITFIKTQVQNSNEEVEYTKEVLQAPQTEAEQKTEGNRGHSEDEMFGDAVRVVVSAQKASASMLQRKLRIGYNRAARLVDEMEEARVIGPAQGSSPRKVLIVNAEKFLNGGVDETEMSDTDIEQEADDYEPDLEA